MRSERRGGFGLDSSNGGANSDNWLKSKEEEGLGSGGAFDSLRERRGVFDSNGADSGSWGKKREEGSCGGRPRLNLQPRTLPVMDLLQQREAFGVGMAERGRSTRPKMLGGNRNQWFLVPKGCILGLSQIK